MKTVCELNMCTGCSLCVDICPHKAITIKDDFLHLNAVIDDNCTECSLCKKKCSQINDVERHRYLKMHDGYANDDSIRKNGSSGGVATAIIKAFLENNGAVCSCRFTEGGFRYYMTENTEDYNLFKGSKYTKSNPNGIYKGIKRKLTENKKVLMIGLPCQIAAAKSFIGLNENFFTIDLICHGTPSSKFINMFAAENNKKIDSLKEITFRTGTDYGISFDGKRIVPPSVRDNYLLAFLCGIDYTENCYNCKYANLERAGDLTLGDSWESELPESEKKKGISLILCQTDKGKQLLQMSDISLFQTNEEKAIAQQDQLREPVQKNRYFYKFRDVFDGKNFNDAVRKTLAYKCFKQRIKRIILKFKHVK